MARTGGSQRPRDFNVVRQAVLEGFVARAASIAFDAEDSAAV
jgi:hypothetical protein